MYVGAGPPPSARPSHLCLCPTGPSLALQVPSPASSLHSSGFPRWLPASALRRRVSLSCSGSRGQPCKLGPDAAALPSQPPRQVDPHSLPLIPPPSAAAAPAVLVPCLLALLPPALLGACPRLETANWRPQQERRQRPAALCVCARVAGPLPHSPDSRFHSLSGPRIPCPHHTPSLANRYARAPLGFPPN